MKTTVTFYTETAELNVTPVCKFNEDREQHPFMVQIIPASPLLPVETLTVKEPYYFLAAATALDEYKEKHGLDSGESWSFTN